MSVCRRPDLLHGPGSRRSVLWVRRPPRGLLRQGHRPPGHPACARRPPQVPPRRGPARMPSMPSFAHPEEPFLMSLALMEELMIPPGDTGPQPHGLWCGRRTEGGGSASPWALQEGFCDAGTGSCPAQPTNAHLELQEGSRNAGKDRAVIIAGLRFLCGGCGVCPQLCLPLCPQPLSEM